MYPLKQSLLLFVPFFLVNHAIHLKATKSSFPSKDKQQVLLPTLAMLLSSKLGKAPPKRSLAACSFVPMHIITDAPSRQIPTPRKGDKVMLSTGRVAEVTKIAPYFRKNKPLTFLYSVKGRQRTTKKLLYDEHLAGLCSKLARYEYELALGDTVLVERQDVLPIGRVEYIDKASVGLNKVNEPPLDWQQILVHSSQCQPPKGGWLVSKKNITCMLAREKRYKVHMSDDRKETYKKVLGLRYPLAARSPMGSVIYQASTSKFMRMKSYFMQHATHNVLLQGETNQVLGTEDELLLPACTNGSHAWASGKLSLYSLINKSDTDKAWIPYTYTLCPTTNYTARLLLCAPHHKARQVNNHWLPLNSACKSVFWCDKKTIPCHYGLTLKQTSQPLVVSFANERDRHIFYNALVWLTSPYVLAIEEVNQQPTGHTRLLACDDIGNMRLQQLAQYMKGQWLLREGTLHQEIHFLDPHFTFEGHQQQSLSDYYDWSPKKRYKKVYISCYRKSHTDCIARFGRYPQLDKKGQKPNICPDIAIFMDDEKTLSLEKLHTEGCQRLCRYVRYLSGEKHDYTFKDAKKHMATYYHGRPISCPDHSHKKKCRYAGLDTTEAKCHCLMYSHAPTRTRNPQSLPSGTSPFKSQEDPDKATQSQYQPSYPEAQCLDSTQGYLQHFMHEQITNGYLYVWAGYDKREMDFPAHEHDYKKRLGYKKDDPSILNLSLSLPELKTIHHKFTSPRHQAMGVPLTLAELAAMYAYTAWERLCKDFNKALRSGNYHKWRWMDGLLHKAITKLSFLENGHYPLYTGFKDIHLTKRRQSDQRWSDYTSSTPYTDIAKQFEKDEDTSIAHKSHNVMITIDPSMRRSPHVPCCDVSWISPYPDEHEVLFARGTAGHIKSSTIGADGWEVEVIGENDELQNLQVWHKPIFKQVANHPTGMMSQLFGSSWSFPFEPTTYLQAIHRLLSGQPVDVNQKLGVKKSISPLLCLASELGHLQVVKYLLNQPDIQVTLQNWEGMSSLYMAAQDGHIEVIKPLLADNNIKVNLQDYQGFSPLCIATQNGQKAIVKELLTHSNIDVNLQNQEGSSPLYIAVQDKQTAIIKLLLAHPEIKVNLQDYQGFSPLYIAAQNGYTDIVSLLLEHKKIDVNLPQYTGGFPLYIATQNGHTDIVNLLLKHKNINVNLQDYQGCSSLYIAINNGYTGIIDSLLEHENINVNLQNYQGLSPLYIAVEDGQTPIVKQLLAHAAIQVNLAKSNPQTTPLDGVYEKMQATQDPAVWDTYHTIWQLLQKQGAQLSYYANHQLQPPKKPVQLSLQTHAKHSDEKPSLVSEKKEDE